MLSLIERWLVTKEDQDYRDLAAVLGVRFRRYFLGTGIPAFVAEDLAETLITDLVIKFHHYTPQADASFEAWLNRLMRNRAMDWHRSQKGKKFEPVEELVEQLRSPEVESDLWVDLEMQEAVVEAIAKLDERDRIVLELRNLGEERTFEEIAQILGITNGNARVRYFRAKKQLKELLESDQRVSHKLELPVAVTKTPG